MAIVAYTRLSGDPRVIREIQAAIECGFAVDIYTLRDSRSVSLNGLEVIVPYYGQYKGGSRLLYVLSYVRFFFFVLFRLSIIHFKKRYTIVQADNMPNFLIFVGIVPKLFGAKLILDIHDLVPELFAEKFNIPLHHPVIRLLYLEERISANFADVVISTNRLHSKRFKENRIHKSDFPEILNGADESVFTPYLLHDFSKDPVVIVYPTTIAKRLGIDILVETIDILVKEHKPVLLKIFGDGEYRDGLKQLISDKKLEENIVLSDGIVDFDTLSTELEHAHIGIIPWPRNLSTNMQMPNKIHEYFIKGMCVVASDLQALREYFSNCILFAKAGDPKDIAEKISYLLENREEMKAFALKGHSFYQANPWKKYKSAYMKILENLSNT